MPGIVFLSGGQSDEQASENLNAINSLGPQPWVLSFSYGRALQAPALKAWSGSADNVEAGQSFLALRARCNSAAVRSLYWWRASAKREGRRPAPSRAQPLRRVPEEHERLALHFPSSRR